MINEAENFPSCLVCVIAVLFPRTDWEAAQPFQRKQAAVLFADSPKCDICKGVS